MENASAILRAIDDVVWGPLMLVFMLGTGGYLMVRMRFLPIRNLGYALKLAMGFGRHTKKKRKRRYLFLSSLMTELAATIGTGNIVGVATAMVLGGPGALVWMLLSALVGFSTKLAESLLAVKYRTVNDRERFRADQCIRCFTGLRIESWAECAALCLHCLLSLHPLGWGI